METLPYSKMPGRLPSSHHPFACDKCPGSFTRREHLLRHYRTHENVKPYECSICSQTFGRKDLRDRHERNLHQTIRTVLPKKMADGLPHLPVEAPTSRKPSMTPLSAETQRLCLDLFFRCFATSNPIIHRATFNADKRGSGLIRAMMAIGGFYSTDSEIRNTTKRIYTEEWSSMRQLFVTLKHEDPRSFDVITEVLLLSAFTFSQLDKHRFQDSRHLLLEALQFARKLGIGKALVSTANKPPTSLHQRWIEWVKYESFKRLALAYMVIDGISAVVFGAQTLISFLELKHNLPVDEMIWQASTAEEWENACMTTSANSESPVIDAIHQLLNFYRVPQNLNEFSSILLSTCLLTNIRELNTWKALYIRNDDKFNADSSVFGRELAYNQEICTRESQLRFAMNVMLDKARTQRLMTNSASSLWDMTSAIQQMGYLRLYLPSVQNVQGIVSADWGTLMRETVLVIVSEDLGSVDYRPITLLLNWFIELILSQLHLQYQDLSRSNGVTYTATESPIGCVLLVHAMVDIWRLVRFTALYGLQIAQSPELCLARRAFLDTVRELSESVSVSNVMRSSTVVAEDAFALALKGICLNMYQATKMGTFRVAAESFSLLHTLVQANAAGLPMDTAESPSNAWEMISRCF